MIDKRMSCFLHTVKSYYMIDKRFLLLFLCNVK